MDNNKSLVKQFTWLFVMLSLVTLILSGVMTYINQTNTYHNECITNLHQVTGYIDRTIQSEGSEFAILRDWYNEHRELITIPKDFRSDFPRAEAEYLKYAEEHYDGRTPGHGISFSDMDNEGKRLFVIYRYEYWFTVFFDASEEFELSYIYFVFPSDEDKHLMNYMFDSALGTAKFPDGKEYVVLEPDVYEDPELHHYMWEAWNTGKAPEGIDSLNNEYGYVYTYCRPLILDGEKIGLICADVSVERINKSIFKSVLRQMLIIATIFGVITLILYSFLSKRIIGRIVKLKKNIVSYSEKKDPEVAATIMRHTGQMDEIGTLYERFASMILSLDEYMNELQTVTAEKERIGAELNIANKIQADMLPRIFPAFPEIEEFDIYATMTPAKEVGGDFYDFFMIDESHLGVVIADVSGKGVPAALFMVIAKTLIKNRLMSGESPSEALCNVNEQLCEGNDIGYFVTVWAAVIDIKTGDAVESNAGHEYPAICRKDGIFELIRTRHSPAVAALEGMKFRQNEFHLEPGDSFFVYTDGVTESTDSEQKMFGEERLIQTLNANRDCDPEELLPAVGKAIEEFVGEAPQFDDITMVGFRFNGDMK